MNRRGFLKARHMCGMIDTECTPCEYAVANLGWLEEQKPRWAKAVRMRVEDGATLREIGNELGVGRERARTIYLRALQELRFWGAGYHVCGGGTMPPPWVKIRSRIRRKR